MPHSGHSARRALVYGDTGKRTSGLAAFGTAEHRPGPFSPAVPSRWGAGPIIGRPKTENRQGSSTAVSGRRRTTPSPPVNLDGPAFGRCPLAVGLLVIEKPAGSPSPAAPSPCGAGTHRPARPFDASHGRLQSRRPQAVEGRRLPRRSPLSIVLTSQRVARLNAAARRLEPWGLHLILPVFVPFAGKKSSG